MPVDLRNADDSTALHLSAAKGNLEATKALVERGAAMNNTNLFYVTPLMCAASNGKLDVVRYLTDIVAVADS
jgi:ankyrin repeat protein